MTTLEATRGDVRAALSSVLPHAGRESEETPQLGRVRLYPVADALLVWATDHTTSGFARVAGPEYSDAELEGWDMPASAVKKVLQVFAGPANRDARMVWADQPLRVEVTKDHVTFTEVGSFMDGQSLTVDRIRPDGSEDRYPDVPRQLVAIARLTTARPAQTVAVRMDAIARFVPAAKAYVGPEVPIATIAPAEGVHRVLVRIGDVFLGDAPAYPVAGGDDAGKHLDLVRWWVGLLGPLRRPEPVKVPAAVVEDLTAQAAEVIRDSGGGGTTSLRIVRGDEP